MPMLNLGVINKQIFSHHHHHHHQQRPPTNASSPMSPHHHSHVIITIDVWPHPPTSMVHNEHTTNARRSTMMTLHVNGPLWTAASSDVTWKSHITYRTNAGHVDTTQ
jgi:hypothetical protein